MIWIFGHPSFERLSRYADGELEGPRRDRIASHLAGCTRCQGTLRFIRELGVVARQLQSPEPPQDAVARFLARRAAGDRVILPTADPVPIEPQRRRIAPVVAAGIGMVVFGTLLVSVARLQADRSRLDFAPNRPTAGETIDVRYVPGALLRSEPTLVLRARYRYVSGAHEILDVARLDRVIGGEFRGGFTLPDSVVYAVFAVEDTAASRVDHNNRRLWELIVHDERGRPLLAALRERYNEGVKGGDWQEAYQTALVMTESYPEKAEGWYLRYMLERAELRMGSGDSLRSFHQNRLDALVPTMPREPDANELASLAMYALALGDDSGPYWRERLLTSAPGHPAALALRLGTVVSNDAPPDSVLQAVEAIWDSGSANPRTLFNVAIRAAVASNDIAAVLRWTKRVVDQEPEGAADFLATYLPMVRDLGHARALTDSLSVWILKAGSHNRALFRTTEQGRRWSQRQVAMVRGTLGAILVDRGQVDAGIRLLGDALANVWRSDWFQVAGIAALTQGDTAAAITYLAAYAADPLTSTEAARAALARLDPVDLAGDVWLPSVEQARNDLRSRMLAEGITRSIETDARVESSSGGTYTLGEILAGKHTVVAFWTRRSRPALAKLPELERLASRLAGLGANIIVITGDSATTLAYDVARSVIPTVPVYFDRSGEAIRTFGHMSYPQYFVVDDNADIRFEFSTLDDAVRQVYVLLQTPDANVVVD